MKKALEHPFFESVRDVGSEVECESPVDLSKLNTIAAMNMDEMNHFLEEELSFWAIFQSNACIQQGTLPLPIEVFLQGRLAYQCKGIIGI